jgi:serine/threonine-protein kinase
LVGPYLVDELRSEGGFALLYRARDTASGAAGGVEAQRWVALKVLREALVEERTLVRFAQESEAIAALDHPNIVRVEATGELSDGRPWMAMPWLEGVSLRAWLERRGALSLREIATLFAPLADALDAVHARGIVHRDIKAENVMVHEAAGRLVPTLVDFGIAKLLEPSLARAKTVHTVLGTPVAMAPEQILRQPVDARTDVYAVGVLLHQLATGVAPFTAKTAVELEELHLHARPPRASALAPVPRAFDDVIERCLAKHPNDRFPRATDVARALAALVDDAGGGHAHLPSSAEASALRYGIAVHAHALPRVGATDDDDDDDLVLDEVEAGLDAAHAVLDEAAFAVAVEHARLLVTTAPASADEAVVFRVALLAADRVAQRTPRTARVTFSVIVHAAVDPRALLELTEWPITRSEGAFVTARAVGETTPNDMLGADEPTLAGATTTLRRLVPPP